MKRTVMMAAVFALVLVLGVVAVAAAQGPGPVDNPPGPAALGNGPGYGPGINGQAPLARFQDRSQAQLRNFVDEDGDGVCDNLGLMQGMAQRRGFAHRAALGNGTGPMGLHQGQGQGYGAGNFVDADGDGVCDNFVDEDGDGINDLAPRDGTGHQYGKGANRWNQ